MARALKADEFRNRSRPMMFLLSRTFPIRANRPKYQRSASLTSYKVATNVGQLILLPRVFCSQGATLTDIDGGRLLRSRVCDRVLTAIVEEP
jgi:hypothetical protein